MTNTDKAKNLRDTRKRLGLNQREMAGELGLDPSYLSQLENAIRPIDEWYLTRASEIEKKISRNQGILPDRQKCVEYLETFLDTCGEDSAKLGWTLVHLQESFPLNRWGRSGGSSSASVSKDTQRAVAGSVSAQRLARESKKGRK